MSNDNGERKLPTRAGWWWYGDESLPSLIEVAEKDGALVALAYNRDILVTPSALRWLAPIPGPAVLAALAEWAEAHELDCTEAGHQDRFWDAEIALADAIRAERDGAA